MNEMSPDVTTGFRTNNFDLIRLLAAMQVVVMHGRDHLDAKASDLVFLWRVLAAFPGVPIFFVISGFLISMSWERSECTSDYVRNRLLRIYPGLWVCFLISVLSVFLAGFRPVADSLWQFVVWVFAQLSIAQFYNPHFMRDYGVGTLNGSLWTIPVELQFYLLVPVLYAGIKRTVTHSNRLLFLLIGGFLSAHIVFIQFQYLEGTLAGKLISCSFVPWFHLFLIGVLCQRNWATLQPWLRGRLPAWLLGYACVATTCGFVGMMAGGNRMNPVASIVIAGVVLSAAFTVPGIGNCLLRRNDISYGVYIYHMPVVNALLFLGCSGALGMLLLLSVTILLGVLSWVFVERPALSLKRMSIRAQSAV